jgi:folate-binding protein YgfZ
MNRTSLLQNEYSRLGTALGSFRGAQAPLRFDDPRLEYLAVRQTAGFFDYTFRTRYSATGSDRVRFLHSMVSNDVKSLTAGQGTYALLLDARGHILADLRIYAAAEDLLLEFDAAWAEKALAALNYYNVGGRVPITAVEGAAISFQGPRARALLEACLEAALPPLAAHQYAVAPFQGASAFVARVDSTGVEGYEAFVAGESFAALWQAAVRQAPAFGARPCGTEALEMLRIEAGIPACGSDFGEDTLPLEAGLLNAVSFTKGCYIGQEIVERARSRGHVNWKLVGFLPEREAAVGEKFSADGREVGELTSVVFSPALGRTIALGYARREFAEPGKALAMAGGGTATVAALPFVDGGSAAPSAPA